MMGELKPETENSPFWSILGSDFDNLTEEKPMFSDEQIRKARKLFQEEIAKHPRKRISEDTLAILEKVAYHRAVKPEPFSLPETSIKDILPKPNEKRSEMGKKLHDVAKEYNIRQNVQKIKNTGFSKKLILRLLQKVGKI